MHDIEATLVAGPALGPGARVAARRASGSSAAQAVTDAERRRRIIEHVADGLVGLLREVDRFPLANRKAGPLG